MKQEPGARITRIANPHGGVLPKVVRGGSMAVKKTASKSRARNAKKSGGATKKKSGRSRSRARNHASVGSGRSAGYKRVTPKAKNPAKRKRGKSRSRFGRSRNPFSVSGLGEILKELGYAGGGAFGVSTLSQIVPIPVTSPVAILIVQGILSWIVGWLGGKLFGKKNEAMIRTGGFAFAAGNFVQNQFPGLQQKILSFSPIRAARSVAGAPAAAIAAGEGAALTDRIMTTDELGDISVLQRGQYPYLSDISSVRPNQFAYAS